MSRDLGPRASWVELVVGWIFTLLLLAFAVEALAQMVKPLLPWLGLGLVAYIAVTLWLRQRDRW